MRTHFAAAVGLALLASSAFAGPPTYSIAPVPSSDTTRYAWPNAINEHGQVVGALLTFNGAGTDQPFLWSAASGHTPLPSGFHGATDINNHGQVAGPWGIWSSSTGVKPLDFVPRFINDAGTALGHEAIWDAVNGVTFLNRPPDHPDVEGFGLNESGHIAGTAWDSSSYPSGFQWQSAGQVPVKVDEVDRPPGGTYAFGINDNGWMTGWSNGTAYLWRPGVGTTELLSIFPEETERLEGLALNNAGVVLGRAITGLEVEPFYYTLGDGMHNLHSLLDASGSGWRIGWISDINEAGQIVGVGTFNGVPTGFVLTPVPEPAALSLLIVPGILLRRRR